MNARVLNLKSLFWPVLFFIAGIITSFYDTIDHLGVLSSVIWGVVIVSVLLGILLRSRTAYPLRYLLCLCIFYTSGYGITTFQKNQYEQFSRKLADNNNPTGTITDISHFSKMDRIQVRLIAQQWWNPPHYFNINLLEKNSNFRKGHRIELDRHLLPITSSANPFTFHAMKYWKLQNTSHEVFLYDASDIRIIHRNPLSFTDIIRQKAAHRIDIMYPRTSQAGILKALLLGQKETVSQADKEDFKKAGLMHILAVSGLHVGIISALLFILLLPVKLLFPGSWAHFMLVVIALWLYAALTGMNTPVVRAVILMSFYLTARRIDRQIDKWNIYFWAVLLVLVIHPMSLLTISFQLSFGAVAAILLFYRILHERVKPILGQNYFSGLVAVSLAAQIGIFPFLLFHFQEISMVSTLSSFLVIPLLFPLILISSLSLMIPDSISWLGAGLSHCGKIIVDLITSISGTMAGWNISSQVWVWNTTTLLCILLALFLAGLYLETRKNTLLPWLLQGSALCLIAAGISEGMNIYQKRNQCEIAVYENNRQLITDIYFQGVCYTNYKEAPPPFLIRNRKKYYTQKSTYISDELVWEQLINIISDQLSRSIFKKRRIVEVTDYTTSRKYIVDFASPSNGFNSDFVPDYIQVLTSYKPE